MRHFVLEVKTDADLGSASFVREFVSGWCNHPNDLLRPDRFGSAEPARRKIAVEGTEPAIQMWLETGLTPVFKRVAAPKFECRIDWRKKAGIGRQSAFPWGAQIRIDGSASQEIVIQFLQFFVHMFQPVFGSIASEEERAENHKITYPSHGGIAQKFVGLEVGDKFPGIYWLTYFGHLAIQRLGGPEKFESLTAAKVFQVGNGIAVMAYDNCDDWSAPLSRGAVMQLREALGTDNFFSKAQIGAERGNT